MLIPRALLTPAGAAVVAALTAGSAAAQAHPVRPITMVIPFPAGTPVDVVVRVLADRLTLTLGQPIVVEHRPGGAGGTVGAKAVANAAPDGYTLLLSPPGALVVAPVLYQNLGYDPAKAFAPIATLFSAPQMLVVNPGVPVGSLQELVHYARLNPGKINFASPGYGTQPHLLGEMLRLSADVQIAHVPYKGPAQLITDLLAGQVQMTFEVITLLLPQVEAGRLKALALADTARSPQWPAVPTTTESGYPNLQGTFWAGVLAPAGTPAPIVSRLNSAINEVMRSKELKTALAKLSARPKTGSPQDFADFMAAETRKWAEIVTTAGIKIE
jgi:tripartite-type tricarboxylate transporter receptor subunit TctC